MIDDRPNTPAKGRYVRSMLLLDEAGRRLDEDDADGVHAAVAQGVLPESVLETTRDWPFDLDEANDYFRGFREASDAIVESKQPKLSIEEELLRLEYDYTDRIRSIDHSGRGSGCCQSEHGLKQRRKVVRWLLFGRWDIVH